MRAAKVQASLRIRTESRGTFRQKTRSLAPLNGWACAVEICDDGMLEDTNSLDGAHLMNFLLLFFFFQVCFVSSKRATDGQIVNSSGCIDEQVKKF